jgi:hypothetical protein
MHGRRLACLLAIAFLVATRAEARSAAPAENPLAVARIAYNHGDYSGAIAAAQEAAQDTKRRGEAQLILGRALIERFRQNAEPGDLTAAREALGAAAPAAVGPLRIEWLVGVAETLFFDEQFGAAAAMFDTIRADSQVDAAVPGGRERLLDWWATAADRAAQTLEPKQRHEMYDHLASELGRELERDPSLGPASYWYVVAARSAGDVDLAWDAALAAWVRAPLARDRGAQLRADLDRIMTQAIIPERARRAGREQEKQVATLHDQWEEFKKRWSAGS